MDHVSSMMCDDEVTIMKVHAGLTKRRLAGRQVMENGLRLLH